MGVFFTLQQQMKTSVLVLLFSVFIAIVSAQTTEFLPPSALASSPDTVSPVSPASPEGITYVIYELSPLSAFSPSPFTNLIVLPSVFSYGSGPFSPYSKIPTSHLHNNVSPIPSLSPISFPTYSPFAPLFGSHSDAGALQMSMGLLVACIIAVFAF